MAQIKFKIKNSSGGITLIEIVVVIFIIALFSMILISDFPKIQRQFALSRVTYKLAQDLRKTQDLGLSGVQIKDSQGNPIAAKGYGIYISTPPTEQYVIYADRGNNPNYKYDNSSSQLCSDNTEPESDCILETIDVSKENPDLKIKNIENIIGSYVSINFRPPDPIVDIDTLSSSSSKIGIVLGLSSDSSAIRKVWVNTSGLINVQ